MTLAHVEMCIRGCPTINPAEDKAIGVMNHVVSALAGQVEFKTDD